MVPLPGAVPGPRSVLPTLIFSLVSIWATGALAAVGADLTQEAVHRRGDESVPKDSHTGGLIWPGDAAVNDIVWPWRLLRERLSVPVSAC